MRGERGARTLYQELRAPDLHAAGAWPLERGPCEIVAYANCIE
jgi:hypothetical protein